MLPPLLQLPHFTGSVVQPAELQAMMKGAAAQAMMKGAAAQAMMKGAAAQAMGPNMLQVRIDLLVH
jgi:hypothetical protein